MVDLKRHLYWIGLCVATALISAAGADLAKEASALRLELDLIDGSRLIGTPGIATVPVQTSYAKMDVPLTQIQALKIGDDHETVTLNLRNGDTLTGLISLKPIELKTVFGTVSIGIERLRAIRVVRSDGAMPEALRKGLVLHYSFDRDEDGKVTDGSAKENHGTVRGARFTPEGISGGAMVFDGADDYLDAGNSPSLQLTANFTLAAWICQEQTQTHFGIITKSQGHPEQDRRGIEFMLNMGGGLCAYFWDASTRFFSGGVKNKIIRQQEWTHVVLQHDSALPDHQMRMFINGVPCEMGFGYEAIPSIPVVRNVAEPVRIGCMRPGKEHFKGRMDDVMIFSRTLSADEIQTLYGIQK
jgi:hypothetical protein